MAEIEIVRRGGEGPKFVTGSLLRHILAMTAAGAIGLMAIFVGDLANIYFLSRIGDDAIVAAVGYASSILFFSTSIGIGLSIAATSLVAPALGAQRRARARRLTANAHVLAFAFSAIASLLLWLTVGPALRLLGASGRTFDLASFYLAYLLPTLPFLALGMTSSAVLRSVGDARRAMNVTLWGAIANTILDLIFIVHFGLGIEGAVLSSAIARVVMMGVGLCGVVRVHDLMGRSKIATLRQDVSPYWRIALPAVLTNVAPAVGNAYITHAIAPFGDAAVAAWAIIGRITPVAFGAIYALSGVVGPILGQNFGARAHTRMRDAYTLSLLTMAAFTGVAWLLLAALAGPLASLFHATGEIRQLIVFFCRWLAPLFVFLGAVFITNAVFNTLGRPHLSTLLNWGRATVGTVPFVIWGGQLYGAEGVLAGNMVGGIAFGLIAILAGYRLIAQVGETMRL
ncbi:MATE family efflux transporter [Hyphomicrobium sp.]|uniref:MATE family efflux transporter n=1 Tax=Hyphomicrobium sp. TaxID=82 RepID=UPI000F9FDE5F|nr:MATE family efflux transporter [Hyphomicrobium sp.]RUO99736.1 MAG: MATE family efflux transporter [Hyphomicrobium sp.]